MRLLPYVRLSIETDETTSPERQLDKIQTLAKLGDHELVPITEADYDLNVSGSVSPFDRPGLGRWLRDDWLDQWDAICVAKLDRLTRSLRDFVNLIAWLDARGKALVCIDPAFDLSTPAGRAFANMSATFAQFERETIAARVLEAWHKIRDSGKYGGGQVPFGYRPAKLDKGWGYEPDLEYGPIVAEMFDRYVGYESLGSITRWLNESGIPTPWNVTRKRNGKELKDTIWKATSVRKILSSPAALGATVKTDGTPVRDEDGMVIYRADALVSRDVWERAQARLAANPVSAKVNSWPLSGVAFCAVCGASMYSSTARYGGKEYRYYCCVHSLRRDGLCVARRVEAGELEGALSDELLAFAGHCELTEKKTIAGRDFSEEINRTVEQMTHLFKEVQLGALSGEDVSEKQAALQRAQAELKRLHSLKPVPPREKPVGTGQTFRQRWESLDATGRNEFLRSTGVRAVVSRDAMPPLEFTSRPVRQRTMAVIDRPKLHVALYFGNLAELLNRASDLSITVQA